MTDKRINREEWISDVMEKYQSMLLSYVYSLTGEYEKTQDIVQDTFLKLCKADIQKLTYPKAWLFKVSRNRALEVKRKEHKMQPLTDEFMDKQPADIRSPYDEAERNDSFSRIVKLMETLPEKQKEIVYLKFQSDLSYKEISKVAEISVSNVGVILHTAIKNIRSQMLQEV